LDDQIGGKITFKGNNNSLKVQKNYFCNGTIFCCSKSLFYWSSRSR